MSEKSFKVTVTFEARPDGGLRVYSDDVPGLVLSHSNVDGVLADVENAMRVILSHMLETEVEVSPLEDMREMLERRGVVPQAARSGSVIPGRREYVAFRHHQ